MLSIHLQNLLFKNTHGLYNEEKILGNIFQVNLIVKYKPQNLPIVNINETINYENLFSIVEKRMLVANELLETLVTLISEDIFNSYSFVKNVNITITKLNPPIKGFIGNVAISFEKSLD